VLIEHSSSALTIDYEGAWSTEQRRGLGANAQELGGSGAAQQWATQRPVESSEMLAQRSRSLLTDRGQGRVLARVTRRDGFAVGVTQQQHPRRASEGE
jgi:hypothetical protein